VLRIAAERLVSTVSRQRDRYALPRLLGDVVSRQIRVVVERLVEVPQDGVAEHGVDIGCLNESRAERRADVPGDGLRPWALVVLGVGESDWEALDIGAADAQ